MYGRPRNPPAGSARAGIWNMGLTTLGAGCPTGPAMPPGPWLGLGGTCAPPLAPDLQRLLSVHRQSNRSGRFVAGSFYARVQDLGKLPLGARRLCDVGNQRDAKLADRSLPAHQAGSHYRFARRQDARGREQAIERAASRRIGLTGRIERASAKRVDKTFATCNNWNTRRFKPSCRCQRVR
jgi:hypothetical protein